MWTPNIAALSAHHRTYAMDTITDIGLSVARAEIAKPEDLVTWLDEVLAVLVPGSRLDLMGMSYGGWLASQYALRFPDRLRKVVLLAPGATVLPMSLGFLIRIALIAIPFPGRHGTAIHRMIGWLFQDLERTGDAGRGPAAMGIADVISAIELDRFFALPWMIWPTVIDDEAWRRFAVPCLFLVGENEKIYSAGAAIRRLTRVAPQIKTGVIPGAGHDLTLVQADLVAETVLRFLADPRRERLMRSDH
jgi:pimeloyl-ACP methyl ester carboxylesterase